MAARDFAGGADFSEPAGAARRDPKEGTFPEVTDPSIRSRFAAAPVAHLATADGRGRPHVVPITFAVDDEDSIVTAVDQKPKRGRNLKRLRNIAANPRVSVLVDHYEEDWAALWWVRADGAATIVEAEPGKAEPLRRLQSKYVQYRDEVPDGPVIVIAVDHWVSWNATPRS